MLLAGGRSLRMGRGEKALIEIAGSPMLAHVIARLRPQVGHLVINANGDPARFSSFSLPVVADTLDGFAGLHAGLEWARRKTPSARFVASAPADTPFLPCDLVARLKAALLQSPSRSAIAASGGKPHPVFGLWDIALTDDLAAALQRGVRAMHRFAEAEASTVVDFPLIEIGATKVDPFFNVNTRADLETAQTLMATMAAGEPARG